MPQARWEDAIIPNGTAVSNAIELKFGERIIGLETPVAWTAADIVCQINRTGDDATYVDVMDLAGTLIRATNIAAAAVEFRSIGNDINSFDIPFGPHKVRLRSCNTASSADVNQGAARTVRVLIAKD